MPDVLEPAKSGRSRCRGCGEKIEKGALRFGEAVENPYDEEENATTLRWFHLLCGADKRPEKVAAVLAEWAGEEAIPDRPLLEEIIEWGTKNPELARVRRAERAPSGRARCRECRELIEKDALRVVIDVDDEAMTMGSNYFVHAACAGKHVGPVGLIEKLRRTSETLDAGGLDELATLVAAEPG